MTLTSTSIFKDDRLPDMEIRIEKNVQIVFKGEVVKEIDYHVYNTRDFAAGVIEGILYTQKTAITPAKP